MLAIAARGELPQSRERGAKAPKRVLELTLLNEKVRLKGENEALRKLLGGPKWPQPVQLALQEADKAAEKAKKKEAEDLGKKLLAEVKQELAHGSSGDAVRQRLRPRVFVFDFSSSSESLSAARPRSTKSQLELLASTVSFIIASASKHDEALLRLTSPGGAVSTYGLVAASVAELRRPWGAGGYMMACVASSIVAAPFAMVGSIGVLAGVPNFHKVLERNQVEFQQVTAGKYKRTVNVLTPNTEEGLAKFREDVDTIHQAFKDHISQFRPQMDIEGLATGEVWLGTAALGKGLVDGLGTSDELIRAKVLAGFDAVELSAAKKEKQGLAKLFEGLGPPASEALQVFAARLGDAASTLLRRFRGQAAEPRLEAPHLHGTGC